MPASSGLKPVASATTSAGNVALPAAWVKNASRRSTIQAPSVPPATASSEQLDERVAHERQLDEVGRRGHRTQPKRESILTVSSCRSWERKFAVAESYGDGQLRLIVAFGG